MSIGSYKTVPTNFPKESSVVRLVESEREKLSPTKISHVDLPRINREKTESFPASRVDENMKDLWNAISNGKCTDDLARINSVEILDRLIPILKRSSGFELKKPHLVENIPQFSQSPKTLYYILPFKYESVTLQSLDIGYVQFKVPKPNPKKKDNFKDFRSYDGIHLSPLKFWMYLSEFVQNGLMKLIDISNIPFKESSDLEDQQIESVEANLGESNITNNSKETTPCETDILDDCSSVLDVSDRSVNVSNHHIDVSDRSVNEDVGSTNEILEDNRKQEDKDTVISLDIDSKESENGVVEQPNFTESETMPINGMEAASNKCSNSDNVLVDNVNVQYAISKVRKKSRLKVDSSLLDSESPFCFNLACGWRVEIVPAIFTSLNDPMYVMNPYEADENVNSDIRWRLCFSKRESKLLRTISVSDKDLRLSAIKIVSACVMSDSRLSRITDYQIQTCLLHEMDVSVDTSPRWQRHTLEMCVKSLFKRILMFISSKNLPHFFIKDFNLLEYWTDVDLKTASSALHRICSNDKVLDNLVHRTLRKIIED